MICVLLLNVFYAECSVFIVMLRVILMNVIMLSVIFLLLS